MLREIAGRAIGRHAPIFVIAEIGLNHGGSVDRALAMTDAAASAGASAIKLQTLDANYLVAESCPAPAHVQAASLREFFATFELNAEAHRAVVARARERGLAVLTTPLSIEAMPMLETLGFDGYKIASGDLTFDGLIHAAAVTGRPLVLSTGMSTLPEIDRAIAVARDAGQGAIALLHCVSAYPAPIESQNLAAIATLERSFHTPVGLSDHGVGTHGATDGAIAAVALGACIYERHFVLEDDQDAVDRAVSSTPAEFERLIAAMERTRLSLGDGRKVCQAAERPNVIPSRRGLYATRALRAGARISFEDVVALRPASALAPRECGRLVGSILERDVPAGAPFAIQDVQDVMMERAS